ncbi:MAG TPA: hypothetical protein VI011_17490 [Asanoa sp.]|jgi:hypothetical protein
MSETLEVRFVALNDRFDEDDPRWLEQVAGLVQDLRRGTDSVRSRRAPVAGTKGAVDQLILSLGSAGAFSIAVQMIRTWLARDKHRAVEMTFTDSEGRTRTIRVSADNAGSDALAPLISAASMLAKEP